MLCNCGNGDKEGRVLKYEAHMKENAVREHRDTNIHKGKKKALRN